MAKWSRIMHEHWTQKGGKMVAKLQFKTINEALSYMDSKRINKDVFHPYLCSECGLWHIGHIFKKNRKRKK